MRNTSLFDFKDNNLFFVNLGILCVFYEEFPPNGEASHNRRWIFQIRTKFLKFWRTHHVKLFLPLKRGHTFVRSQVSEECTYMYMYMNISPSEKRTPLESGHFPDPKMRNHFPWKKLGNMYTKNFITPKNREKNSKTLLSTLISKQKLHEKVFF